MQTSMSSTKCPVAILVNFIISCGEKYIIYVKGHKVSTLLKEGKAVSSNLT